MLFTATLEVASLSARLVQPASVGQSVGKESSPVVRLEGTCGLGSYMLVLTPTQWGQLLQSPWECVTCQCPHLCLNLGAVMLLKKSYLQGFDSSLDEDKRTFLRPCVASMLELNTHSQGARAPDQQPSSLQSACSIPPASSSPCA